LRHTDAFAALPSDRLVSRIELSSRERGELTLAACVVSA
jgi:hypothetical protein